MSERVWISMGFIEGETTYEAAEALGHKQVSKAEKVGGYSEFQTDKGTMQLLQISDTGKCRWLAFRLVDPTAPRMEGYVPGKKPRKPRADAGKPRKMAGGFTVVSEVPDV